MPPPGAPLIGVVLRPGTWSIYGFWKEALQGVQRVAFSRGYGLVVINPAPTSDLEDKYYLDSLPGILSGLLLMAPEIKPDLLNALADKEMPSVVLFRRFERLSYVEVDNEGGARMAVEHLIQLGHQRIAFLNGPPDSSDAKDRMAGYVTALKKNNIPYREDYILAADFEQAKAYRAMQELLKRNPPPTAVFAANDYMALGAISAIQDEGLSVPGHVAVVGFDDLELPNLTFRLPPLTTVRQPVYEIAKEGTELLILLMEGRIQENRQKVFPSQLIVRSTSGSYIQETKSTP